jgi:hypothetical protein
MNPLSPQRRIIAAILLLIGLFNAANYYLDLGFFGRFGRLVFSVSLLLLVIVMWWLGLFSSKYERSK